MNRVSRQVAFILFVASPLLGQNSWDHFHERVLLPVVITIPGGVPGAHQSLWAAQLSISNHGDTPVSVQGFDPLPGGCGGVPCPDAYRVNPGATIYPKMEVYGRNGTRGMYLWVERVRAEDISISLRVQDLSRQGLTWGTRLSPVRESEALTSTANLVDVPSGAEFRQLLRVYDFDREFPVPAAKHNVAVSVYQVDSTQPYPHLTTPSDRLLGEFVLPFITGGLGPGYVEQDLGSIVSLSTTGRIRVEVRPLTEGLRFWTFVSVTNNVTQHVTVVEP